MTPTKTLYLETMGCQMNALDSELVMDEFADMGYQPTEDMVHADLVVINTCSVRQHAEDKVYSRLGQLKGQSGQSPDQIVAVIGCMAERDADGLLAKASLVDILCGPSDLHRLPGLVADVQERRTPAVAISGALQDRSTDPWHDGNHEDLESLDSSRNFGLSSHVATPKVFGRHQAYVRITRGCNKFCTYCVVPYTRGRERHRSPDRIVDEVRRLAAGGVVEVTLLGQTVNHYRHEDENGRVTTFANLIRRVHDEVEGLPRLRFVTSYPRDFNDDTLRAMAESPRICRYLHVPAQSGSNTVLKRMNRGYTVEEYKDLLDRARSFMPDICIAGDMIVGFSGEMDADFEKSLDLLRYAKYKNCFVFKYSPRPGTTADNRLPDDVPDDVKRQRNNAMLAVQAEVNEANHEALIGHTVEVLVEGRSKNAKKESEATQPAQSCGSASDQPSRKYKNQLTGRTGGDQIVVFDGTPDMIGQFVHVQIIGHTPYTLQGNIIPGKH